jgi:hypothetical protein
VCITPSVVVRDYSLGSGVHTHLEVVCVSSLGGGVCYSLGGGVHYSLTR